MSTHAVSKMTSKNQITIPAVVRDVLALDKGDSLAFEISDDGVVVVRRAEPFDATFARALESQLSEWASAADDEAYREL